MGYNDMVQRYVVVNMEENLLTPAQFAQLARTTKRTITWYSDQGILPPFEVNKDGYRYYQPRQVLDFQVILLLRKLRFSIDEIRRYLAKNGSLKNLFKLKRSDIATEIEQLRRASHNLDRYYENLDTTGTLVNPVIKRVEEFNIYYLEKEGSYAKIGDYCLELKSYFSRIPKNAVFLTLFLDKNYQPKKSRMKIAVVVNNGMLLNKNAAGLIKKGLVPTYKALSYTHEGSGAVLSTLWQEMSKYARKNNYSPNTNLSFADLEFYKRTSLNDCNDEDKMVFELNLPVS